MRRITLLVTLLCLGIAAVFVLSRQGSDITVQNATAFPVGEHGLLMVSADIVNSGAPETLSTITSPNAEARLMSPKGMPLVIPAQSRAALAMDGAHAMLRGEASGGFVPVTLVFESGLQVTTQAQIEDAAGMDHSLENGVAADPAPLITATLSAKDDGGHMLSIETKNITLKRVKEDAPHVAGEGHAHVYLNGLKMGRLYDTTFEIGALPKGAYALTVSLNTHDHRPYIANGQAISAELAFSVD